jgi:hypothetical protein
VLKKNKGNIKFEYFYIGHPLDQFPTYSFYKFLGLEKIRWENLWKKEEVEYDDTEMNESIRNIGKEIFPEFTHLWTPQKND